MQLVAVPGKATVPEVVTGGSPLSDK
jgi:hypothetical protein